LRLFINNIELDLPINFTVARTKQVNDIGSLNNRQANFTQKIKLPKTKKNKTAFDNLGEGVSVSRLPYERNGAFLYNDTGQCEIFNGWAVITNTDKYYNVVIYDGSIDFYKAIDNRVLTEVGVSDLNHTKNTATVLSSWSDTSPYRYIVADYNGKIFYNDGVNDVLNIDYLVPSVKVKWLWDKVFSFFGFTYSGNTFQTEEFTNLWMTFPKGLSNTEIVPELIYTNNSFTAVSAYADDTLYLDHTSPAPTEGQFVYNDVGFQVAESATYVFTFSGTIELAVEDNYGNVIDGIATQVYLAINPVNLTTDEPTNIVSPNGAYSLQEGDVVTWYAVANPRQNRNIVNVEFNSLDITINKLEGNVIDFENALIDFKIKDFFNEILWRFNLTPFKNKYTNQIEFLTLTERLQNTDYYDWSDRFVNEVDETYIYKNYAQENNLRYKYNDQESDFNDGIININNVNLKDSADVIKSKIYSPNLELNTIYNDFYNVYPLWQKEANENASSIDVKYKSLDKRFYFLRSETITQSGFIGSESLSESEVLTAYPRERFTRLSFSDIVQDYYEPMQGILNDTRVKDINIYLDNNLVHNIDFKKLIFIKQLGNYYMLNIIPNYINKGVYKVGVVRVKYSSIAQSQNTFITITNYNTATNKLSFVVNDYNLNTVILQTSADSGVTWSSGSVTTVSPKTLGLNSGDLVRFKHSAEDLYSNTYVI